MKLRLTKSWQTEANDLVVEVRVAGADESSGLPKKAFITISPNRPKPPYVTATLEKPGSMSHKGVGTQLMRKHMIPGTILALQQSADCKWLRLSIGAGGKLWYLARQPTRPPEILILADDAQVLAKLTPRSQFTKRYRLEDDQLQALEAITPDDIARLIAPLARHSLRPEPQESSGTDDNGSSEPATPEAEKLRSLIRTRLKRRLKTLAKAVEKAGRDLPTAETITEAEEIATLLSGNLHQLRYGAASVTLMGFDGAEHEITLDPDLSPGRNLEAKYKAIKKMRGRLKHGTEQLNITVVARDRAMQQLEDLGTQPLTRLRSLADELGIAVATPAQPKSSASSRDRRLPYHEIAIKDGVTALVAKSAKDGDSLVKGAKSNDFWLHACGTEGAHVIVPYSMIRAPRPDPDTLRYACILAIHNSKLKTDLAGEVYFSQKRHLRKQKGMKPGLWAVDRSETIFVKYNQEELDALLGAP